MNWCHPLEALGPARQSLAGSRQPFLAGINEDLSLTDKMNTNYKEAFTKRGVYGSTSGWKTAITIISYDSCKREKGQKRQFACERSAI